MGLSEDLARLSELYEARELTDAEFVAAKQALLESPQDGRSPAGVGGPRVFESPMTGPSPFAVLPPPTVAQPATGGVAWAAVRSWAKDADWKATFKVVAGAMAAGVGMLCALLGVALLLLVRDGSDFPGPEDLGVDGGGKTFLLALQGVAAVVAMSFRGAWHGHASGGGEDFLGAANMSVEVVLPFFGVAVLLLGALYIAVRRHHRTHEVTSVRDAAAAAVAYGVAFSAFIAAAAIVARGSLPVEQEFFAIDMGFRMGFIGPVQWSLVLGTASAFVALRPWRAARTWPSVDGRITAVTAGVAAVGLQLAVATVGVGGYLVYQTLVSSQGAELDFPGRLGLFLASLVVALPLAGSYLGMFGIGGSLGSSADSPFAAGGATSVGIFGDDPLPAAAQIAAVVVAALAAYAGGLWLAARHRSESPAPAIPVFAATYALLWGLIAFFTSGRAQVGGEMLGEAASAAPRVGFSILGVVVGGALLALAMAWAARRSADAVLPRLQRAGPFGRMFPFAAPAVADASPDASLYDGAAPMHAAYSYPVVPVAAGTEPMVPGVESNLPAEDPPVTDTATAEFDDVVHSAVPGPGSESTRRRTVVRWSAVGVVLLVLAGAGVLVVRQHRAIGALTADFTGAEAQIATLEEDLSSAQDEIDAAEQAVEDAEANEATALDELATARRALSEVEERADDTEARAANAEETLAYSATSDYGSDAYLDGLVEDCADGDYFACTDLYFDSPVDSGYEEFGATCGHDFSTWACSDY